MIERIFLLIICVLGGMILPTAAQDVSNASTVKAEEISNRMIEFLKSIKTIDDFSLENVERIMKTKVVFDKENRQNYGFGGTIEGASKWKFNFSIYSFPNDKNKTNPALNFSFDYLNDDEKSRGEDYSPVCRVDFDAYSKALKDAEFSSAPYFGEHGRLLWWIFTRGTVSVQITTHGENNARVKHECVSLLVVNIGGANR